MIKLSFHGAMSSVGASGVLLDTGTERMVFDYGTKIQEAPPIFPIPIEGKIDAILLSHAHLDHSGAVPVLEARKNGAPVFTPNVTKQLSELLWTDSIKISHEEDYALPFDKKDVRVTMSNFVNTNFHKPFKIKKSTVTLFDAGHIPGSTMPYVDTGEKTFLYTGDYKIAPTRLMKGADTDLPDVDILITESTYCDREHPDRKSQEKELVRIVRSTLANDGIALISGFAVGRIDELLLVLNHYGIDYPVYVDGMAKKALTIINQNHHLLKEPKSLNRILEKVEYVKDQGMRKRIIKNPGVILSTSGMLSGGPIVWYIQKLFDKQNCSLVLSGYQCVSGDTVITLSDEEESIKDVFKLSEKFIGNDLLEIRKSNSEVINFNLKTTSLVENGVVFAAKRKYRGRLIKITTVDGDELILSSDHPVLTKSMVYKRAGELTKTDEIIMVRK